MRRTPFVGNDGGVVAADSFVVAKKPPHNETFQPVYPASVYLQGVGGSVAPVVRGSSGETVDPPEGTKYAFQEGTFVPQGVTIDPATGVISVGTDSKPGERGLEVVVTYPDGTVDEVIADARLEANDAAKFQPEYPPATLERGQEVTLRPEFKDAADEPVAAPGEVKYRHKDGAVELPTGVSLAEDGSVTVGADTPAGTYHVLMTVTYPDKSSGTSRRRSLSPRRITRPSASATRRPGQCTGSWPRPARSSRTTTGRRMRRRARSTRRWANCRRACVWSRPTAR